jgi:L-Ala-D/L-Glu epimerase
MTLSAQVSCESWALNEPFEIAREVMHRLPLIHLTLTDAQGRSGHAEAAGVDYEGETMQTLARQIDAAAPHLADNLSGEDLLALLPPGGARNALDCALWDLRAKQQGRPAWAAAGLDRLQPVLSTFTIGLGSPDDIRRRARAAREFPLLKLKVDAQRHVALLQALRDERPDARVLVDANQAWSVDLLERLMPDLLHFGVELIEQPLPRADDAALAGRSWPIPLAADESCTDRRSLPALAGRYQAVNIKLDKTGGLTEALAVAREARALRLDLMVGNMCGTSLGMAPAHLLAQHARWADLDGPLLQREDRPHAMDYRGGLVQPPSPALWG